ncbi:MAG: hypothetical protein JW841_01320 [Deltaproteobacteria bacterium]|nr:hypothetical protein [Deltaproteobacteria bacterium]
MLKISVGIDLDNLYSGITRIANKQVRLQYNEILDCVSSSIIRINNFDFVHFEKQAEISLPNELWQYAEGTLSKVWISLEDLHRILNSLVLIHDTNLDEIETQEKITSQNIGKPKTLLDGIPTQLCETAWVVCYSITREIESFQKRLPAILKIDDSWELVGAVQEHFGHLQNAITALLNGLVRCLPGSTGLTKNSGNSANLLAALELRTRIFALRDNVLCLETRAKQQSNVDILNILQDVGRLIDDFENTPAFEWMRAGDKQSIIEQHRAIEELMTFWSPMRYQPSLRAISLLARFLEALEVINYRECLMNHDRTALQKVIDNLENFSKSPGYDIAKSMAALADIQGCDRELDRLLALALDVNSEPPWHAIIARAKEVLAGLGGKPLQSHES